MSARPVRLTDLTGPAAEAVESARAGRPVDIVEEGRVVARIVPADPLVDDEAPDEWETEPPPGRVRFGTLRGQIHIPEDFNDPLEDFAPYS